MSLFWRGQDYLIGNMKMCQISGFALAIGILLESFGFHGREAAILPSTLVP